MHYKYTKFVTLRPAILLVIEEAGGLWTEFLFSCYMLLHFPWLSMIFILLFTYYTVKLSWCEEYLPLFLKIPFPSQVFVATRYLSRQKNDSQFKTS